LTGAIGWLKRHSRPITAGSCLLLACFGLLLTFNRLSWVTSQLEHAMTAIGLARLINV
jgi:hypothetical protein